MKANIDLQNVVDVTANVPAELPPTEIISAGIAHAMTAPADNPEESKLPPGDAVVPGQEKPPAA